MSKTWKQENRDRWNEYMREYRREHPQTTEQRARRAAYQRVWTEVHREPGNLYAREWYRKNRLRLWAKATGKRLGVAPEALLEMGERQHWLCAICKRPESRKSRDGFLAMLSADHDHSTGRLRGLLCGSCNWLIGNCADDPARLRAALRYLRSL